MENTKEQDNVGKSNSFSVALTKNGKPQREVFTLSSIRMESGNFELNLFETMQSKFESQNYDFII